MLPNFSFKQYKEFYERSGKTIDQMSTPKNPLTEDQIENKYKKYLQKLSKQQDKKDKIIEDKKQEIIENKKKMEEGTFDFGVDKKWKAVVEEVTIRDKKCQLKDNLTKQEKDIIYSDSNSSYLLDIVDPAHVFGKGAYPHMKYDVDNVILLSRLFHSRIDHYTDPITGSIIDKEQHTNWWIRLVGKERYNRLLKKSKEKN